MSKYTFDTEALSDLYKDAYGFRPDYAYFKAWLDYQDDFKQVIWDRLLVDLARAVEEEKKNYTDTMEKIRTKYEIKNKHQ